MGSKQSKPSEPEHQLYAVATPHPTMKWIYPVYAAPLDAPPPPEKKGRSSPLAWIGDRAKNKSDIPIVTEHENALVTDGDGHAEDGVWYHFHVDASGAVDYVRPGTTLPNTYPETPYTPRTLEGSVAPSMSMAGVPYEESYYSYPASPAYQGYYQPQPQRISHSDAYSMGSTPYPRARSVSPVLQSRAITPTNLKPRRATTPTPRRPKTPNCEPAPPIPDHIAPVSGSRRNVTPFPRGKGLPLSPHSMDDRERPVEYHREYKVDHRELRGGMYTSTSGRTSGRPSADEESTAIASSMPRDYASTSMKSSRSRPYSPTPPSDATYAIARVSNKPARHHYPSPSTVNSQPTPRHGVYA